MNKTIAIAAIVLALGAGAGIAQNKVTRSIPVDDSFGDGSVRWTGATPGGYEAYIALKANKGVFEFCGVGVTTNIQLRSSVNNMLRGCKLNINGKIVLRNCSHFAKARSKGALRGTKANCAATNMKVQKVNLLDFQYGDGTCRN